jgi:hypothetical protein
LQPNLGAAIDAARADNAPFGPLFETATIEHQVFVQAYDRYGQPAELTWTILFSIAPAIRGSFLLSSGSHQIDQSTIANVRALFL